MFLTLIIVELLRKFKSAIISSLKSRLILTSRTCSQLYFSINKLVNAFINFYVLYNIFKYRLKYFKSISEASKSISPKKIFPIKKNDDDNNNNSYCNENDIVPNNNINNR